MNRVRQTISHSLLFGLLLGAFLATGALAAGNDADWRPVPPAELAMKTSSVEPDADAEAIFWDVWIDDKGRGIKLKNYIRVKIFTARGREQFAKFDLPFGEGVKIKDLAARVIRNDGTIVDVGAEDIFEREIVKAGGLKVKAMTFAIPNIQPGVIVEYQYTEEREYGGASGMRLALQKDIPVETLEYYYKPDSKEPSYQTYNSSDVKFVKDADGYFVARSVNVPAFKSEPYMAPEDTIRPWMLLMADQAVSIFSGGLNLFTITHKDQSDKPEEYWRGVAGRNSAFYGPYLNKRNDNFEKSAQEITNGLSSPDDQLRKLYSFCQKEITNTTYEKTPVETKTTRIVGVADLAEVLKHRSAGSFTINLIFGALANALGFETRLVLAGNRSEMFFTPELVNSRFLHIAGVAVKVGGVWKVLDPGNPYLPYGMLNWYEEGTSAMMIGEKDFFWAHTEINTYKVSNIQRTGKIKLLADGSIEGELRIEYTGHPAVLYRSRNSHDPIEKLQQSLENEIKAHYSGADVSDVKIENLKEPDKALVQSFRIRLAGYAQKTGKRLFLQPGFFEYGNTPLFTSNLRKYEIDFPYPWSEYDLLDIELPKGYQLESAETPGPITDPNKIGSIDVRMRMDETNNILHYSRRFYFGGGGQLRFPASSYPAVKELFDAFNKADNHTLVLKQGL